jgi:hypothetical protein
MMSSQHILLSMLPASLSSLSRFSVATQKLQPEIKFPLSLARRLWQAPRLSKAHIFGMGIAWNFKEV